MSKGVATDGWSQHSQREGVEWNEESALCPLPWDGIGRGYLSFYYSRTVPGSLRQVRELHMSKLYSIFLRPQIKLVNNVCRSGVDSLSFNTISHTLNDYSL